MTGGHKARCLRALPIRKLSFQFRAAATSNGDHDMATDLIGLCGVSDSGKDTIGEILCDTHGFSRVSVADPIKNILMALFDLEREQLWSAGRNTHVGRLQCTPRKLFQDFGDFCERIDPDVWIRQACNRIACEREHGNRVVVTDMRTEHAAEAIRRLGGVLWLVRRPGSGAPGTLGQHRHKCELPDKPPVCFDGIIDNSGTRSHLSVLVDITLLGAPAPPHRNGDPTITPTGSSSPGLHRISSFANSSIHGAGPLPGIARSRDQTLPPLVPRSLGPLVPRPLGPFAA